MDLSNDGSNKEGEAMMIVAFGKAFAVTEEAPKKQIMNTLAREVFNSPVSHLNLRFSIAICHNC